jgi:hypothetical protein
LQFVRNMAKPRRTIKEQESFKGLVFMV